ncbi:MAG: N-6 DNA methylase [Synergistaceae bacterium]|nr:N-6 DNA methylase [Synergistaceae bacterium]
MYSLSELFKNSTHDDSIFSPETVSAIEAMIYTKESRGKITPFIKCIIRKKEIRLTPEEAVRQLYVYRLIHEYGYDPENIRLEHGINFGREVKRADIVIFEKDHPNSEYIIVEVKKPNSRDGKAQLKSYCNASGAIMGVWTNGQDFDYYRRKDPNYFEDIPDIPKAKQKLRDILKERWTISDLEDKDKLRDGKKSLTSLIQEMEDDVLAGAGVDVFEEVFKLIYTKLFDEMQSGRDKSRVLEFRNYGDTDSDLKANIQALFSQAMGKWPGVFNDNATISLTPSHLSVCVSALQEVKLFNSNLDVIDDAFEYLMSKSQKGEKGQFFTPRYVIDMCVKMLNPQKHESMIDTAAGSCGFPVHTIFHVWKNILAEKGSEQSHLFTAEEKPPECQDYVKDKVFAIDFDENAVRVARTLNLIAGDGRTNVIHLNTLDYGRWEETTKAEEWIDIYNDGWKGLRRHRKVKDSNADFMFDIVMANPPFAGDIKEGKIISRYELAKDSKGKYASKIGRDILFIERNIHFLKPGGRMAIILPQGRFNNSSDKYIRDFIARECRILAVIGLHENVFKPHTGTKTSVLFVQKWDEELCPKRDDYPVFFATMRKPGKDNSGDKIYVRDSEGRILRDAHYHPIVDHDLYNHDGLTQDGIAEAFIEFAKREGLSFFGDARFSEELYGELVSGLEVSEVMLSEILADCRMDAEYYSKKYLAIYDKLQNCVLLGDIAEMHDVFSNGAFAFVLNTLKDNGEKVVPYIRSMNVGNMFINSDELARISAKAHQVLPLSQTRLHDIMMARTGKIGGASIITQGEVNYNCNQNVIKLTINEPEKYNPYYIAAFFNCKYGILQVERQSTGNVQPWVNISKLKELQCFMSSLPFQRVIEDKLKTAHDILREATQSYAQAQTLLNDAVHFTPSEMSASNTATVSFSQAFSTGRLDAEYFMPKYDELFAHLETLPTKKLGEIVTITKSIEPGSEYYSTEGIPFIRVSDITAMGITPPAIRIPRDIVPDIETLYPKEDTILLSKDGSIGIAYKVDSDIEAVTSGALLHLHVTDSEVLPDYLALVLNSEIVQLQAERDSNGAIIKHWKPDDIARVVVPIFDRDTQQTISENVRKSFALRKESERLITLAVKSVELAIEHDENTAMNLIINS